MEIDFTKLTDAELEKINKKLKAEIDRRKKIEEELAREELKKLLDRLNELQEKYDVIISCRDNEGDYIFDANSFMIG